jgi:hypothetical protein
MNGPKTATATWQTQYMLNVTTDYGTPFGEGWQNAGSTVQVGLDVGIVAGTPGTQYVFSHWGGNASGTNYASFDDIVMDSPKAAVANWKTQYQLNCTTNPLDLLPAPTKTPAGEWFDEGTNVTLEAQDVVGYTFDYWTIDDLEIFIIESSFNITMDAPHSVVAVYQEIVTTPTSPTTTTPTTPTSPTPGGDIMVLALVGGGAIAAIIIVLIVILKRKSG